MLNLVFLSFFSEKSWKTSLEIDGESTEITLRPMEKSDEEDFNEWSTEYKVTRFCTVEAYIPKNDHSLKYSQYRAIPNIWFRVISMNNKAIGFISVSPNFGLDECRADLAYALAYKYWGKGIVTAAVKVVACKIFSEWPHLQRLEAMVDMENKGSQRVLEKAGFLKEGVLRKYLVKRGMPRDMVMFSLLDTDVGVSNKQVELKI
ncbi:hypothetical protein HAX54_031591 [Datura stramonium]|uniref:N-acetyltransferase domain-containing protein n=1 Tax=Datura stramonium TaxID=4076 RepID=A0ABS8RLQ5_DATST|nr:hypothetical protein [Datura stramonium]